MKQCWLFVISALNFGDCSLKKLQGLESDIMQTSHQFSKQKTQQKKKLSNHNPKQLCHALANKQNAFSKPSFSIVRHVGLGV